MTQIGIAISTRNRPEHLKLCLAHMIAYVPMDYNTDIIVCDDNSSHSNHLINMQTCAHWGVTYHYHPNRIGVALNKNFGISSHKNSDVIFLFDDDSFPNHPQWACEYVQMSEKLRVHHLTYTPWMPSQRTERDGIYISQWGMGCCMFMTREIIDVIGGFDPKYQMFGFEHLAYGRRAFASGLNQDYGAYLTPIGAIDKIYTLDYEYVTLKQQPTLSNIEFEHKRSVLIDVPNNVVNENRALYDANNDVMHVPI